MKERPILFNGEMVRAILEGRKTQTRRIVNVPLRCRNTGCELTPGELSEREKTSVDTLCPYGGPGERLWVRETWGVHPEVERETLYRADAPWNTGYKAEWDGFKWKPSIHIPRDRSRITLEISGVKVEKVTEISEEDAIAEGIGYDGSVYPPRVFNYAKNEWQRGGFPSTAFGQLWERINGKRGFGWEKNPWVWVIAFKRL